METSDDEVALVEGEDYYFENGLMVLTARYLLRRGYCCEQGCRHCPYPDTNKGLPAEERS
jgi:hypothetical protein